MKKHSVSSIPARIKVGQAAIEFDVVFVLDKCLMPLAQDVTFPRKCILWAPPPDEGPQEHLMHDRWLRALEYAQGRVRAADNIPTPSLLPEARLLFRNSLDAQGKLVMWVAGKPCAPRDTLAAWAEMVVGISPVGIGRFGLAANRTENKRASDSVAGQNDWSWWVGHEDMLVGTAPMVVPHPSRSAREFGEQCCRALANRTLLAFGPSDNPAVLATDHVADTFPKNVEPMAPFYRMFNQLAPLMRQRHLLPGHQGVEWHGANGAQALFAYAAFNYPLPAGARVERVDGNSVAPVAAVSALRTEPYTADRVTAPDR